MIRWIVPAVIAGFGLYLCFFGIAVDKGANARINPLRHELMIAKLHEDALLAEHRCLMARAGDCRNEIDHAEAVLRAPPPPMPRH
ncbi:hypothetical protein [Rhizosaccharibacter radicis]|uniref:Uncharacterized protein n=1 Tax=Rhizosaccharibacter radicis TaxID=2782605 RepID=A0ABT1VTP0_9PROT|nr:hypothetical protein [Acetobacteraceae bacterium KSS12]